MDEVLEDGWSAIAPDGDTLLRGYVSGFSQPARSRRSGDGRAGARGRRRGRGRQRNRLLPRQRRGAAPPGPRRRPPRDDRPAPRVLRRRPRRRMDAALGVADAADRPHGTHRPSPAHAATGRGRGAARSRPGSRSAKRTTARAWRTSPGLSPATRRPTPRCSRNARLLEAAGPALLGGLRRRSTRSRAPGCTSPTSATTWSTSRPIPTRAGAGFGAAVTWAATLADPSKPALLIASDPGQPVYERMGYLRLMRMTMWGGAPA